MKTTQPTVYTVRAHDGLLAVRFDVEVSIIGDAPRVTVMKNGHVWCDEVSVTEACKAVTYLTIPQPRKATLRNRIEQAAFAAAVTE